MMKEKNHQLLNVQDALKLSIVRGMSVPKSIKEELLENIKTKNAKENWTKL